MKIAKGLRICLRLDRTNPQTLIGTIHKGQGKKIGRVTKIMSVARQPGLDPYEHPGDFVGTWYVVKIKSAIFDPMNADVKKADEVAALRLSVISPEGKEITSLPVDTDGLRILSLFE